MALSDYVGLITSEHADKPNFVASVTQSVQPFVDWQSQVGNIPVLYDLDNAVGAQLDTLGQWIGRTRYVLNGLDDPHYRVLLTAAIVHNQWDGTIDGGCSLWNTLFGASSYQLVLQDNGDLTMTMGIYNVVPDATVLSLLTGGYLDLRPSGIKIHEYAAATAPNAPLFGLGANGAGMAGFGEGCWAQILTPTP